MIRAYRNPTSFPERDFVRYISIDPAKKNFVSRIETRKDSGEIIVDLFEVIPLCFEKPYKIETIICNLQEYLTSKLHLMKDVRMIVIETQMDQASTNIKIQYFLLGFFLNNPLFEQCIILEISPKLKGKVLGCEKGLKGYHLKRWGVEKAKEICERNKDLVSLEIIREHKVSKKNKVKDDDLADTVLMLEATLIEIERMNKVNGLE